MTLDAPLRLVEDYPAREAWQLSWARRLDARPTDHSGAPDYAGQQRLDAHSASRLSEPAPPKSMPIPVARLSALAQGRHDLAVLRSSQLDASRLDTELFSMLYEQLLRAFSMFQPGQVSDFEPELTAFMRLLVFGLSIWLGHATPGSQLLNLRYRSERQHRTGTRAPGAAVGNANETPVTSSLVQVQPLGGKTGVEGPGLSLQQRLALGAGLVVVPYIWTRLGDLAARGWRGGWLGQASERQDQTLNTWDDALIEQQQEGQEEGQQGRAKEQLEAQQHEMHHQESLQGAEAPGSEDHSTGTLPLGLPTALSHRLHRVWVRCLLAFSATLRQPGSVWSLMQQLEGVYHAAALANVFVFLAGGQYRSLLERLVGARLVYRQAAMTRIISFEYLNRQLVWQEVSELLLFALPLLDSLRARGALARVLPCLPDPRGMLTQGGAAVAAAIQDRVSAVTPVTRPTAGTGDGGPVGEQAKECAGEAAKREAEPSGRDQAGKSAPAQPAIPQGPCPICGTAEPLIPLLAVPCGHCFCYYCLAAHTGASKHFTCPLDGVRVAAMERWRPGRRVMPALSSHV